MRTSHPAYLGNAAEPKPVSYTHLDVYKRQLQALIAGTTFDRARASGLLNAKIGAVQAQGPGVISAAADFYDSLNTAQQTQVREFMSRHRRGD